MYRRILVPIEHSRFDVFILEHVRGLARHCGAELVLLHVADGFAARNLHQLALRDSEEMRGDRAYIQRIVNGLLADGFKAEALLATGDPAKEIVAAARRENCDLIAMATHGHRWLQDIFRGSTASAVRHESDIPVLFVRGVPDRG